MNLLVAVGSRHDQVCSIGAFARAEAHALTPFFKRVEILEPTEDGNYPQTSKFRDFKPDVILFHSPSLHDRKQPWNALISALKIRKAYPSALFIPVVHEYSEAPSHWRARQVLIALMSDGIIVNSDADEVGLMRWKEKILKTNLGPTLEIPALKTFGAEDLKSTILMDRSELSREFGIDKSKKWILHPGLLTPGKGLDRLSNLPSISELGAILVVIGGLGPKRRDLNFANQAVENLRKKYGDSFLWLNSPSDSVFQKWLLASDLVLLPYDAGVSERRSSFLSAMHCGANIATTIGSYSKALNLDHSAVHILDQEWNFALQGALSESEDLVVSRRIRNLKWAGTRSWNNRVSDLLGFFKR